VARLCKELNVPCVALAGTIAEGAQQAREHGLTSYFSIMDRPMSLEDSIRRAPELLERTAEFVTRLFSIRRAAPSSL
jgi:glycerate kinase